MKTSTKKISSFLFQRQVAKLRRARPNELKLFSAFFTIWEKASVIDSDIYFHCCLNFSSKSGNLPNKGLLELYFVKPQPFWHNGNVCQSEGPCFFNIEVRMIEKNVLLHFEQVDQRRDEKIKNK